MKDSTKKAIKAMETFGTLYCDEKVLAEMPGKQKGKLEFFTLGKYVFDDELEKEYQKRGLVPADPYSLAEYHQKNPKFYDEKRFTATHWKNADGKWCYAAFRRWDDVRSVVVGRDDDDWSDGWWFGGVRESPALGSSDALSLDGYICEIGGKKYKLTEL